MEKKEIIYDHYKETCEICRNNEKDRNKLFTILCVLLTVLFLFIIAETNTIRILQMLLIEKYECNVDISIGTIQSLLWILLLYFTVRYYQLCINIERLYQYIHNLEKKMNDEFNLDIMREGKNYLQDYPWILNYIWIIYTIFFPVLYFVLIISKIIMDVYTDNFDWNVCMHIILGICNIILTLSYLIFLHKNNIKKCFQKNNRRNIEINDNIKN